MSAKFHRLFALCAATLIVLSAAGCGKKPTDPDPGPELSQENADDLVQQVAIQIALDKGGWLVDLQSTREAMPLGGPELFDSTASLSKRVLLMNASSRGGGGVRINRDTSFTRSAINYSFFYFYTDTLGDSLANYTPDVIQVDGVSNASGTIVATGFDSVFFSHRGEPFTGTGFEAGSDTINFTGVGDDSLFSKLTPVFRTGAHRYFSTSAFVDYDVLMLRDPTTNPYPLSGTATAFLFADVLNTLDTADQVGTLEASVTFYFDGTQNPVVGITNSVDDSAPKFRYRADLRTGTITRYP